MEDGVSTKEAIDVKKGRKKKESNFNGWKEWRRSKCGKSFWCLMWQHKALDPTYSIKLPNCHVTHNSSIWKHLKVVSSFHNSLLTLVRIEWWKQNLKTPLNKLLLYRTHHFWVMGDENTKIQTAPSLLVFDGWASHQTLINWLDLAQGSLKRELYI